MYGISCVCIHKLRFIRLSYNLKKVQEYPAHYNHYDKLISLLRSRLESYLARTIPTSVFFPARRSRYVCHLSLIHI